MKCRNCGRLIEEGSRFCTYCDCDNYPEMNKVKTKTTHHVVHTNNAYRPILKNDRPTKTQPKKNKKKSGMSSIIVIIIIVYILIMMIVNGR